MVAERLEVRLDAEHRRKLSELVAVRDAPVSDVIRQLIDQSYEDILRERRIAAARRLGEMEVEDVPDPETLSRQLESTYEPGGVS